MSKKNVLTKIMYDWKLHCLKLVAIFSINLVKPNTTEWHMYDKNQMNLFLSPLVEIIQGNKPVLISSPFESYS